MNQPLPYESCLLDPILPLELTGNALRTDKIGPTQLFGRLKHFHDYHYQLEFLRKQKNNRHFQPFK